MSPELGGKEKNFNTHFHVHLPCFSSLITALIIRLRYVFETALILPFIKLSSVMKTSVSGLHKFWEPDRKIFVIAFRIFFLKFLSSFPPFLFYLYLHPSFSLIYFRSPLFVCPIIIYLPFFSPSPLRLKFPSHPFSHSSILFTCLSPPLLSPISISLSFLSAQSIFIRPSIS